MDENGKFRIKVDSHESEVSKQEKWTERNLENDDKGNSLLS